MKSFRLKLAKKSSTFFLKSITISPNLSNTPMIIFSKLKLSNHALTPLVKSNLDSIQLMPFLKRSTRPPKKNPRALPNPEVKKRISLSPTSPTCAKESLIPLKIPTNTAMICPMTGIFPPIVRNAVKTLENRFILGNLILLPNLPKNSPILLTTVVTAPVDLEVAPNALLTAANGLVRVLNADCIVVTPFITPPATDARRLRAILPIFVKP